VTWALVASNQILDLGIEFDNAIVDGGNVHVQGAEFLPDMEDHGEGVHMTLMDDDDLEKCQSTWGFDDGVVLPPDHDIGLGFLGQCVHEAMVKLGIVLSHSISWSM